MTATVRQRDAALLTVALRNVVRGTVSTDAVALDAVSSDFGGMIHRCPRVVVRPLDAEGVAATIDFARARGLTVTVRSAGHSLNGQSLSDGGLLLDMRGLDTIGPIDENAQWMEAEPGVVWRALVATAARKSLVPPVLTSYLRTTVGGTHSAGGLGTSSFRYGTQADNCLALEVVTADGATHWCSRSHHVELFDHVLCGYGYLGVITRVRLALRRHAAHARSRLLVYTSRRRLFEDLGRIVPCGAVDFAGAWGMRVGRRWLYALAITVEHEEEAHQRAAGTFGADFQFDRALAPVDVPFGEFILPTTRDAADALDVSQTRAHPWVDAIMTADAADTFLTEMLAELPETVLDGAWLQLLPLARSQLGKPLFMTPDEERLMLVSIMPTVMAPAMASAANAMSRAARRGVALGGKRYLYGWGDTTQADVEAHFGARWTTLRRLKRHYDPAAVFGSCFMGDDARESV